MRIALTFNLKARHGEAHAEFDTRETVATIVAIVKSLGHHVVPVDVTGSIPKLCTTLAKIRPDLVLNLAEGERGAFREAFYPALFEQLGYAHTGSSASTLALCLDKTLAKRVVEAAGVRVPRGVLVRRDDDVIDLPLPVLVKPNFEGSSKGITVASVVTTQARLRPLVGHLLDRYPSGLVVEEFVDGLDVSVAWIDGIGICPPIGYSYPATGQFAIYDYTLKHDTPERVTVEIPARLDRVTTQRLAAAATRTFEALGVTGYGRADFRITPDREVVFIEMNPLPTLDPEAIDLYGAAAAIGYSAAELFARILAGVERDEQLIQRRILVG